MSASSQEHKSGRSIESLIRMRVLLAIENCSQSPSGRSSNAEAGSLFVPSLRLRISPKSKWGQSESRTGRPITTVGSVPLNGT